MKIDAVTKRWIRNASDEKAAANGCTFDEARGQFVIDWAAKYLRLYEGDQAGEPLIAMPWQVEVTMRMFGWIKDSERWKRKVRRFTKASIWIPKKNGKSPSLAWWGLYLLCADGEMGQKVYLAAKDGTQAREIAGKHAIEMVQASDALMAECKINRSVMAISHLPTHSVMKPISSSDSKTQKAKEGLNGSILIDEAHVVDRAFMSRVSRAGISRSEPLHIEVSTAGDDPESYGKGQYDWGKQVESGEVPDERCLFVCYEVPPSITAAELNDDPVRWGTLANPAWGYTVDKGEFLEDFQRSQASLRDFAEFRMYRLNNWLSSSTPAIKPEDWNACYEKFDVEELLGKECYAGFDLGFKWDSTSLQLWFPWDKEDEYDGRDPNEKRKFRLLSFFWLPEAAARKERSQVKWDDWAARQWITITEGNTADFPLIARRVVEISKLYDIVQLNYDERFAQVMAQDFQDKHHINVHPFAQSAPNYNEPCLEFEQIIIDHRVAHLGNEVMAWQVGNVTFKDRGGVVLPVKPENNRLARIDGPVAAIMGLQCALESEGKSIYSRPGELAL
jgi:phage terminase large subunit-like protein